MAVEMVVGGKFGGTSTRKRVEQTEATLVGVWTDDLPHASLLPSQLHFKCYAGKEHPMDYIILSNTEYGKNVML